LRRMTGYRNCSSTNETFGRMTDAMELDEIMRIDEGGQNSMAALERRIRLQLAACYRIFARREMDDLIFTHLSARLPGGDNRFLFIPFGMLFDEVTASNLLEVDIDGKTAVVGASVNPAGWIVHRVVYEAVPEAR
jgi:ribulose-5-phosphate 4-epimerase/fuculose-1-phosphate aldolase